MISRQTVPGAPATPQQRQTTSPRTLLVHAAAQVRDRVYSEASLCTADGVGDYLCANEKVGSAA